KLIAPDLGNVSIVIVRGAQLVMATAEKVQQVPEKPAGIGGLDEALELQLANAAAQQHEEVLIVEQGKVDSRLVQQREAVRVEGVGLQAAGEQLGSGALRFEVRVDNTAGTGDQLGSTIAGIGDGENFARPGCTAIDKVRNAARQYRGLAGSRSRHHQHGPMHMLDGLPLLVRWRETVMAVVAHEK